MYKIGYDLTQAQISEAYNKISNIIDMPSYYYPTIASILRNANTAGKVLDIGCGNGQLLELVASRYPRMELHGIEPCDKLVDNSQKRLGERAIISQATAYKIPYDNNTFDVVIFSEVLEHLNNPLVALGEAKRVLKHDGYILIGIPCISGYTPFRLIGEAFPHNKIARLLLPREHPNRTRQPIDTGYTYKDIKDLLNQAGFNLIKMRGSEYFPYLLHDIPCLRVLMRKSHIQFVLDPIMNTLRLHRLAYRLFINVSIPS